ncbi:MAG: tetratricopeptide repeat protein [Alistipes sp.]|nr:tetratricopeptide repeat protein [Alistipes sp.]
MKRIIIALFALLLGGGILAAQEEQPTSEAGAAETPAAAEAATPDALWDQANTAYINGDFRAAAAAYERLLADGAVSAKLYYNLANACFKSDRLSEAILYYRRALRLAPGSEDIRYNLSVAEARTKDDIERIPEFFLTGWLRGVRRTMSGTAWSILSLVFLVCALSMMLLYLLARRLPLRKTGFYGTLAAALLFVCATWFAAAERREQQDRTHAVVMPAAVAVKSSPDKSATDLFMLHEGTVVRIADRLGDWCEIVLDDGKKGWLESRKIETI